ncbi:MAG: phosphoenolpyruvate carboxykinase (ATP) [Haloarculaceae archaeon]
MSSQRVEPSGVWDAFPDPAAAENVAYNPDLDELRALAAEDETTTEFGSPAYVSEQRSRCADQTKTLVDHDFESADWEAIEESLEVARERDLVCLDRVVGRHPARTYVCRLFVPAAHARIALAWGKLLEPADGGEPDFQTLQLPDWDRDRQRRIRVLPEVGLTVVLGSDYTGEAKKSFLRLFMFDVKRQGGLGLHAGTKRVRIADDDGETETVGQAFLGLSATGKSTLTGHGCWLDDPEGAEMLQDDVAALLPDGQIAGSEGRGLYIKTDGLDAEEQPALYRAATHESAVFENVWVDEDGAVDFDDDSLTSNGRAVVQRDCLASASEDVDLAEVDQVFFITRNPVMPPVARLTEEQAAVAFMLGESIQTAAGDPDAAGESIRVVGTNPFIVGPEGEEGNRFRALVAANDLECFVLNTGNVGPEGVDVGVRESVSILVGAARGAIDWYHDETLGLDLPRTVPGIDVDAYYPPAHYENYEAELASLREERRDYLDSFETLDDDIRDTVY